MANDYKPVTAQDKASTLGSLVTDLENEKRAADEGVLHEAFVGYEEALDNYQSRSDVETLEQRLAREVGPEFAAAHFARERGVLLGGDDKALEANEDPVKASEDSKKRVEESEKFKRSQAKATGDHAAEFNEPTELEYPDDDEDK